jgi:hypothetical protein
MKRMIFISIIFGLLSLSCRESADIIREVHPENWITLHKEKVRNSGTWSCNQCHPPEGDWPDAPYCTKCHPSSP